MGELTKPNDISENDYRAIEEAVMETARGRWFLAEYAKRNRVSDTTRVVEAIDSLKSYISTEHDPADMLQLRLDIVDMAQTIEQIKSEIANTDDDGVTMSNAQLELNVVLDETEEATSTIKENSEFDKIDELVTEVYTACSFQDLTGQRLRKVVQLLAVLEQGLNNMVSLWDADELERYKKTGAAEKTDDHLKNGPALPDTAQEQNAIDAVLEADEAEDALDWAEASNGSGQDEGEFFVIDDSYEDAPDPNLMAFEADTEDEFTFQAPPAEEVMDDEDDWQLSHAASDEASKNAKLKIENDEGNISPLHARLAQFS